MLAKRDDIELAVPSETEYDCGGAAADAETGEYRIIVPPEPPDFGPAAARAFLRMLVRAHRKHAGESAEAVLEEE
ncbi:hypothetical protein [Actinoplanes flavus]|uniref:Uncharacterized protein n=1 Tax=Actinoplanes flavus TaxID=2820290 RepID=A0ABS3UDN4_9ACTN|nr:hypothetical protein [Actinoplanes flavus]MBO3736556.1 hypothetical protein [Actinoplanes flavus]